MIYLLLWSTILWLLMAVVNSLSGSTSSYDAADELDKSFGTRAWIKDEIHSRTSAQRAPFPTPLRWSSGSPLCYSLGWPSRSRSSSITASSNLRYIGLGFLNLCPASRSLGAHRPVADDAS